MSSLVVRRGMRSAALIRDLPNAGEHFGIEEGCHQHRIELRSARLFQATAGFLDGVTVASNLTMTGKSVNVYNGLDLVTIPANKLRKIRGNSPAKFAFVDALGAHAARSPATLVRSLACPALAELVPQAETATVSGPPTSAK